LSKKHAPIITTIKQAKRLIVFVTGLTVLLVGVALLVLPGPGIITIVLGLAILATEFVWAQRLYKRFEKGAKDIKNSLRNDNKKDGSSPI
jgi:tellurite resistance protein TerC